DVVNPQTVTVKSRQDNTARLENGRAGLQRGCRADVDDHSRAFAACFSGSQPQAEQQHQQAKEPARGRAAPGSQPPGYRMLQPYNFLSNSSSGLAGSGRVIFQRCNWLARDSSPPSAITSRFPDTIQSIGR